MDAHLVDASRAGAVGAEDVAVRKGDEPGTEEFAGLEDLHLVKKEMFFLNAIILNLKPAIVENYHDQ